MGRESADRGIEGLLLSPAPRDSVFIGKALGAFVLMTAINIISAILFLVVMATGATTLNLASMAVTALLGTTGLVLVTTLFAGIAVGSRLGESMLPLLVMPIAIPLMVGSVELTRMALGAETAGHLQWLGLLAIYDLMVAIVAMATFHYVIEE
jgi:heme exporter protein B